MKDWINIIDYHKSPVPFSEDVLTRVRCVYELEDISIYYRVQKNFGLDNWESLDKNETVTHWQNFSKI